MNNDARAIVNTQIEVHVMRQRVLKEIDDAWNELISWQLPPYDDDDVETVTDGASSATLNLSGVGRRQAEHVDDIAGAWSKIGRLDADVAAFCDRLLTRLIRSVTATDCYGATAVKSSTSTGAGQGTSTGRRVVVIEDNNGTRKVSVVAAPTTAGAASVEANPSPELVLDQLEQIFDFLDRTLSGIKISVAPKSVTGTGSSSAAKQQSAMTERLVEESLMQKIGEVAMARILECIYVDCLSKIVENAATETDDEFSKLDRVALLVERFEDSLRHHLKVKAKPSSRADAGREGKSEF